MFIARFFGWGRKTEETNEPIALNSNFLCDTCHANIENNEQINLSCNHSFCAQCILKSVLSQLEEEVEYIHCPICTKVISLEEAETLDPDIIPIIRDKASIRAIHDLATQCPNCKLAFIFEPGIKSEILFNSLGEKIGPEALECIRLNRCSCIKCATNFCIKCGTTPFHEGFTCEEQKLINEGIVCRFCGNPVLNGRELKSSIRVCNKIDCQLLLKQSCKRYYSDCNHQCCGIADEKEHFPCAICNNLICSYCAEALTTKPSIKLRCGHYCHLECVQNMFKAASFDKKIVLPKCGDLKCFEIPNHSAITKEFQKWDPVAIRIKNLRLYHIEVEDLNNDPRVLNPEDQDYYRNTDELARSIFVFYRCQKCGEPYYGGHAECGDDGMHENANYICNVCSNQSKVDCKIHGKANMIYKCFLCCKQATFFCWGTTYFCTECHDFFVKSRIKGPFPVCDGKCPFAPHPPNGSQIIVGYCTTCKLLQQP